jgi:polyisoprenoid-binding protein YceI
MDEFPEITFSSTRVEQAGENKFDVTGDLTIRGVSKPVTVNFELNGGAQDPWGNFRVGFDGHATINRKDWGVNWNAAMEAGGVMVSDKVNLEFEVEGIKVKPAA